MIVGGQFSPETDQALWQSWLSDNGMLAEGEQVYFLADCSLSLDVAPRYDQLNEFLANPENNLTDIKLIGHSEGAATVGQCAADYINSSGNLSAETRAMLEKQLKAVFLLECPTGAGTSLGLKNFNASNLAGVGKSLGETGIKAANIYNSNSLVDRDHLQGWRNVDVGTWYDRVGALSMSACGPLAFAASSFYFYHQLVRTESLSEIKVLLNS